MNRFLATVLLAAPLPLLSQTAPAPATPRAQAGLTLTDDQVKKILHQIDDIQRDIKNGRGEILGKAKAAFQAAAVSDKEARDLYITCYKTNHFDLKDSSAADFVEWKAKNEIKLKDPDFVAGVRFQLQYLLMSLQVLDAQDITSTIPTLQNFMASSEFAKAYFLDEYFRREDWAYSPLDFGGIFAATIFPYYRDKKPAELAGQWDLRINLEFNLQRALLSDTEYSVYYQENHPIREWDKANDLFNSKINPLQALADMLKVVRENPKHPRAVEWVKAVRDLVNQNQPNAPASPAPVVADPVAPAATADAK